MTYVERLPSSTKNLINVAASGFPDLPQKAKIFVDSNIPCTTWVFEVEGKIWVAMDGQTQLLVLNICTAAVNQISSVETGGKPTCLQVRDCMVMVLLKAPTRGAHPLEHVTSQHGWTIAAFGAEHMHRCSEPNQQRGNRREANLYIYMYIHTIQTPIFKLQLYLLFWRLVKALWRL